MPCDGQPQVCVCDAIEGKSWVESPTAGRIKLHLFRSSTRLVSTCVM